MTFHKIAGVAVVALSLAAFPATSALSQQAAPETIAPDSIDGATLDAFAQAVVEVVEVRDEYAGRFEAADSDADRQAIAEEANQLMVAAVEAVDGMDLGTYLAIIEAAQADADLNQRIVSRIENLTGDAG